MNIFTYAKHGRQILGMNSRNLEFIAPLNKRAGKRVADNKLIAKRVLEESGIPTPKTYHVITSLREARSLNPDEFPKSFVLKPNRGFGGSGILVAYTRRANGAWLDNDLREIFWEDIQTHSQDILDGRFGAVDVPDIAFFEERLSADRIFKPFAYRGVPDIRVIVYNRVPIMAMLRLPTPESHGRANLHLGGIGVGIEIETGMTTCAIQYGKVISSAFFSNITIPIWDELLAIAIRAQEATSLGFAGIDIVLSRQRGPVVLEVNARPGLSIQCANLTGLKERLMRVAGLPVDSHERGIHLSKSLFGGQRETKVKGTINGMSIVKVTETVYLKHKDDTQKVVPVKAKIDSGARSSSIDYDLASSVGYGDVVRYIKQFNLDAPMTEKEARELAHRIKQDIQFHPEIKEIKVVLSATGVTLRVTVPLFFELKGKRIETDVNLISREHLTYDMIIGRRDLGGFLIKPREKQ